MSKWTKEYEAIRKDAIACISIARNIAPAEVTEDEIAQFAYDEYDVY